MAVAEPQRTRSGPTHEVVNQVPPLEPYNVFEQDRVLIEAVEREGAGWAADRARALGEIAGGEAAEWGRLANENAPMLRTHDRYGHRIDEVEYHPAYHGLMEVAVSHGVHSLPWTSTPGRARRARGALHVSARPRAGTGCPISMTSRACPRCAPRPELAQEWEPRLTANAYDPRLVPAATRPAR